MAHKVLVAAVPFQSLPASDPVLKEYLNYNPLHNMYTKRQNFPDRSPNETDRGGWRGYDRVYSKYLSSYKNSAINLLEVGIYYGYGVLAWQRYFPQGQVTGIEVRYDVYKQREYSTIESKYPEFKKVNLDFFDSTEPSQWSRYRNNSFDVIIDDGHHHPETQLSTFNNAWSKLKPGGLYFIEDISHKYGTDKIDKIDDLLYNLGKEGHTVDLFTHENLGLKHILETPALRKKQRIIPDAPFIYHEYIAVIHKKLKKENDE